MQISFPCSLSRCCWLSQQDVSKSSHLRGQLGSWGHRSGSRARHQSIGVASSLPRITLLASHHATLTFPHGNAAGMHHQHAGEGRRREEKLNDSPMWAREWLPVSTVDSNSRDWKERVWCMTSRWRGFNMHEQPAPASADWHSPGLPVHSLPWQRLGAPEGICRYAGQVLASS